MNDIERQWEQEPHISWVNVGQTIRFCSIDENGVSFCESVVTEIHPQFFVVASGQRVNTFEITNIQGE